MKGPVLMRNPWEQHQTGALTFTARRHYEDGIWWADSPQIPGWTAAADDLDELWRLVSESPAVYLGWRPGTYTVILLWADRLGPALVA